MKQLNTSSDISVVIPAYNAAATVLKCIESVLAQSTLPREIIIVDDGSEDNIVFALASVKDKVNLIQQDNQGAAVARQTGSAATTSDYIAYLDADDWWPNEKLLELSNFISKYEVHFLLGDLNRAITHPDGEIELLPRNTTFFPKANRVWKQFPLSSEPLLFKVPQEKALDLLLMSFPVFPSTMLVKKSSLLSVGGWDRRFRRCQDFDVGLKLAQHYPLYFYYKIQATLGIHEGNSDENEYIVKQTSGDIYVIETHIESHKNNPALSKKMKHALARKHMNLAYAHRRTNSFDKASGSYWVAFTLTASVHCLFRCVYYFIKSTISRAS